MDGWIRFYPPTIFPTLWAKVEKLVEDGIIVATDEVANELERKADELFGWIQNRVNMLIPLDEPIQHRVLTIMEKFPRFADERTGKSMGDPFVIAVAQIHGLKVITGEKGGTANKPKIPYVCDQFGIQHMGFLDLIKECGWTF